MTNDNERNRHGNVTAEEGRLTALRPPAVDRRERALVRSDRSGPLTVSHSPSSAKPLASSPAAQSTSSPVDQQPSRPAAQSTSSPVDQQPSRPATWALLRRIHQRLVRHLARRILG